MHLTRKKFPKILVLFSPLIIIALIVFFLVSCNTGQYSYYLVGNSDQKKELKELFRLLEEEKDGKERKFVLLNRIASILEEEGEKTREILFLTTYVEKNPVDPYNAFYLILVAKAYEDMNAYPFARHYYERILTNYPDLLFNGSSIHYRCLQALLRLVKDPQYQVNYYKELIARFSDKIDLGAAYYYLAKAYEELGEWDLSIQSYKKFLQFPNAEIPGVPNVHEQIREKVAFYYSDKSWTVPELQALIAAIKRAIRLRSPRRLLRYKAKVNFFTKSWEQEKGNENIALKFDIGSFLLKSKIRVASKLDIASNSREAYLKTTNWTYRIPTWYLYFRKIDFKPDPDIDGRWEWAGIYFGEKL